MNYLSGWNASHVKDLSSLLFELAISPSLENYFQLESLESGFATLKLCLLNFCTFLMGSGYKLKTNLCFSRHGNNYAKHVKHIINMQQSNLIVSRRFKVCPAAGSNPHLSCQNPSNIINYAKVCQDICNTRRIGWIDWDKT